MGLKFNPFTGKLDFTGSAGGGVTSISAGTTGLTPATATTGAVTLAGTLAIANGGTGSTTAPNALTALGAVAKAGDTMTGKLILPASTTTSAPINIPHGADPTPPTNGDIWLNGSIRYRDQAGTTRFVADINRPNIFSQRQAINADSFTTDPALKITQLGSGEALRVEDESPESTPFVISASGRVGIGVAPDATVALKVDSTGVKFGDGTIQTTAASGGTVTSVTGGTGLTGGTITTSGTIAVSYGTTAGTAAEGNDARLSDSRSPSGTAGGDLAGTYPNPTVDGLQGRPVSNATPVNGQVLQYDGANWVPGAIPSGGSGGGGVVYFLNFNTASDAPVTNIPQTPNTSKELGILADTTGTSYLSPILSTASYDFLASFVTDVSTPSATAIPAGIWDFNTFVQSTTTNAANQVYFKLEILKYDGTNAPTLIATSNDTYIYDPTEVTQYVTSIIMPQTTILSTDRIVIYLYGRAHQNNNRLTFRFGGVYPSHTHSTMPSVTGTGVAKVVNGVFQSPASTIVNADVSATAAIDISKLSGVVAKAGDTMTGKLNLPASTTAIAGLNLGNGVIPTTTVAGDVFSSGNNIFFKGTTGGPYIFAYKNDVNTFLVPQIISTTSPTGDSTPALRITQAGGGEAFRVEDSSPDTTPFVISTAGKVGIGVAPDATVALKVDSTGIKFSDNSVQTTAAVAGVTSVTATSPITSTGGTTPVISTSMATNRLLGRSTAATGVAEEIAIGTGLSLTGGTLSNTGVLSDTTAAQGGTQLLNMVQITAAAYNAIVTPTVNTLYIIVG